MIEQAAVVILVCLGCFLCGWWARARTPQHTWDYHPWASRIPILPSWPARGYQPLPCGEPGSPPRGGSGVPRGYCARCGCPL